MPSKMRMATPMATRTSKMDTPTQVAKVSETLPTYSATPANWIRQMGERTKSATATAMRVESFRVRFRKVLASSKVTT